MVMMGSGDGTEVNVNGQFCHCGTRFNRFGSDHCENCGCEEFEGRCDSMVEVNAS
jgi:hypothetical protein